jgi:hypothetical protein
MSMSTNYPEAGQLHPDRRVSLKRCLAAALLGVGTLLSAATAAPANDRFADQPILGGSTNVISISSVGATADPGEPAHSGNPASASVWWTWVAPDNGPVVIDTLGSSFDTVLAVYTGDEVAALAPVAANDDAPGLPTSALGFPAVQGTRYRIAVDGYLGGTGDVRLHIRLPVLPAAPAIVRQPLSLTVPADTHEAVGFGVLATGSLPLEFRWQRTGLDLPAGTNASLSLAPFSAALAGDYRVIISNPFGSVTSSVVTLTVLAETGHDRFADRVVIPGVALAGGAHNLGATTEDGEPMHAGVTSGASLWWAWTAPNSGLVRVDTTGSTNLAGGVLDTVLAVYTGTGLNTLTSVVANDDQSLGVVVSSRVYFRATAGVTYLLAAAGRTQPDGTPAVGFVALNLELGPDNDHFANALPFPSGGTQVFDHNVGATEEPGEPDHSGNMGGKSVWWSWVAPSDGTYALDTVGSGIDTVLAVYTGDAVDALSLVGEDDNRSDDGASLVKFAATAGTTYRIVVDGYTGPNGVESGSIVLNLNPAAVLNDDFAERVTLSGQTNRVTASNVGAGKETGEPNHGNNGGGRSLWWTWTARLDGPVVVTTRGSTFDTALAVYVGNTLSALTLVAENDDANPLDPGAGSTVVFPGVAGQTYQIAVDGYREDDGSVASGTLVLRVTQGTPPQPGGNDDFADRFILAGQTNGVLGLNTNATKEAGEPNHAGNDGGRSLWWSWIAPADGPVRFDTIGSGFETILGVYEGSGVGALTEVAADERSAGNGHSAATFEAVQGVEYQIAVDGFNNGAGAASGRVVLNVHQFPPGALHANDDFEHASPISDPFLTVNGSNIGATRQSGEPAHGTAPTGRSVWWTWTALDDGPVTISTAGSQFDTILGVYTGDSVNALSLVAENDDIDPEELQSTVTFQAAAGTAYRIAVDGYANQIGFITLTVAPGSGTPSAPQIHLPPGDQTRFSDGGGGGTNASFRVVATGSLPLSYQWQRNGSPVPGATNDLLTVTNVAAPDAGAYRVVVSNAFGVVTSAVAELTVVGLPFNDAFANAIAISGTSNVVRGSILGASKQPNEPHHGGEIGGRSVWWTWTAPANGPVEIHTLGSSFDTLLAVYAGSELAGLRRVAQNDDLVRGVPASRVIFDAVAGTEYAIAVDGMKNNGTAGNVVLTIVQPPPGPRIKVQPPSLSSVPVTDPNFSLTVAVEGETRSARFQWHFNGQPILNATNASYAFGPLSRARSGVYFVAITNAFGSVVSRDATVRVELPQVLEPPELLPDGTVRLRFADPDGTILADPSRFEVQHSLSLGGPQETWSITPGQVVVSAGQLVFEDRSAPGGELVRFYRVIEK